MEFRVFERHDKIEIGKASAGGFVVVSVGFGRTGSVSELLVGVSTVEDLLDFVRSNFGDPVADPVDAAVESWRGEDEQAAVLRVLKAGAGLVSTGFAGQTNEWDGALVQLRPFFPEEVEAVRPGTNATAEKAIERFVSRRVAPAEAVAPTGSVRDSFQELAKKVGNLAHRSRLLSDGATSHDLRKWARLAADEAEEALGVYQARAAALHPAVIPKKD